MRAAITASMSRGDPDAAAKALFCHLPWSLFPASARSLALAFANEFFKLAHYRNYGWHIEYPDARRAIELGRGNQKHMAHLVQRQRPLDGQQKSAHSQRRRHLV